jgi:acyl-CoA synthetase (AMP-forming)/AMP-acid ligase II
MTEVLMTEVLMTEAIEQARAPRTTHGVAARLRTHAEAFGDKAAVIDGETPLTYRTRLTYRELDVTSDAYAAGLHRIGIGKGTKTVLMLRPGPDLFTVLFALLKVGAVPVVVDPGMGVRRMLHCYRAAGAEAFIGIPVAHAVRVLNRKAFAGVRTSVTAGRRWFWGGHRLDSLRDGAERDGAERDGAERDAGPAPAITAAITITDDDLLMIGFTTGSTGPAKGVEARHGALAAMVGQIADAHDQGPDDIALVTSPMFGILHLLIGSTCVLAPVDPTRVADADPATIADTIDRFGVTAMFASPALLDPLGRYLTREHRTLPTLRCLASGGAPVSDEVVASLHRGGTRFFTTYGTTEALPISSIDADEILGETRDRTRAGAGTCVGRPVEGLDVRIVRTTDEPMPAWSDSLLAAPGEIGEITIAGPTVSRSYHALPAANAAAKIIQQGGTIEQGRTIEQGGTIETAGERVWHRTGDLGWVDDSGRIWFCGRKSQRVQAPGGVLHTVQCEGILNEHPDVYRTALVGVPRLGGVPGLVGDGSTGGDRSEREPVVCVELRHGVPAADKPRVERELRELAARHEVTRPLSTFLFHPAFPVDIRHNAKINREYLSAWAAHRLRPHLLRPHLLRDLAARSVPLAGWAFLGYGLVGPMPHPLLWALFWIDAFLSTVVHGLQIPVGVKRGRMAGYPAWKSALLTVVFGATWWKQLP